MVSHTSKSSYTPQEKQDCNSCEYWRRQCQNAVKALELLEGEREHTQAQHRLIRLRRYQLPLENFLSLIISIINEIERSKRAAKLVWVFPGGNYGST